MFGFTETLTAIEATNAKALLEEAGCDAIHAKAHGL